MKKKTSRTIDFKKVAHDDLDDYVMQLLIYDSPELSIVLRGHLLVEQVIEALIAQKMQYPEFFFSKQHISFEAKANLAYALGALPETHLSAAKALNRIRNTYAHNEASSLSLEELNSLKIYWQDKQIHAFELACKKGIDEATRITIIFLNWSFLTLLPQARL